MKKTNSGLVQHCQDKLGVHYLYAAKGETVTLGKIKQWAKMYPKYYGSTRVTKAQDWIGEMATDCSGLISWYTGIIRSSQGYYNTATQKGLIRTIPEQPGLAVWMSGHIGIYVGGGYVIEARGFDYGTVKTKLTDRPWTHWLRLCDITYTEIVSINRVLKLIDKPRMSGQDVEQLQKALILFGIPLDGGVDGVFGPGTELAVKRAQQELFPDAPEEWDGKAGERTVKALNLDWILKK